MQNRCLLNRYYKPKFKHMKTTYTGKLRCATCGSDSHFEYKEYKSHIKCTLCNREYLGGYDELLELNSEAIEETKNQIAEDAKKEIENQLKQAFKNNKFLKFK